MNPTRSFCQAYVDLATPENRQWYQRQMAAYQRRPGWASAQQLFLQMIDDYLDAELKKDVAQNIHAHEAGGQFRIAFPHQMIRARQDVFDYMRAVMLCRQKWTDENLYHGYVDCHEVHHEIENYIYFQNPLVYQNFPGHDAALDSVIHVAHHVGNWEKDVPAWYDWDRHEFVSVYLGTRGVKNFPPHDYQEGNHFRFLSVCMLAYIYTKQQRYLDLVEDYCGRWCDHIEAYAGRGEPIPCQILPEDAQTVEMNHAGVFQKSDAYQIFYATVADNTMYDIAGGLLDAYLLTSNPRYLAASEAMMDQFYENGNGKRPAMRFAQGQWQVLGPRDDFDPTSVRGYVCDCAFLARLAVRHNMITGSTKYKEPVLRWARDIDENANHCDQMMAGILTAAHYFDGNPAWLDRAYLMALRVRAVTEPQDEFHQCNWSTSRQGTKFLMEPLYLPLVGDGEFGTRGGIPIQMLRYITDGKQQLDPAIAMRVWLIQGRTYGFEAVNTADRAISWRVFSPTGHNVVIRMNGEEKERLAADPGQTIQGTFTIEKV